MEVLKSENAMRQTIVLVSAAAKAAAAGAVLSGQNMTAPTTTLRKKTLCLSWAKWLHPTFNREAYIPKVFFRWYENTYTFPIFLVALDLRAAIRSIINEDVHGPSFPVGFTLQISNGAIS